MKWLVDRRAWQTCEASEEVGADSFITPPGTLCMHRKPNRVEGGSVCDWLTAMPRPVSHMNRSPVPGPHPYWLVLKNQQLFISKGVQLLHQRVAEASNLATRQNI